MSTRDKNDIIFAKKEVVKMPEADYQRHDISDKIWELLRPHLPGQRGQWGKIAHDNRRFINAVFFILRTCSTWRDLPPDYGKWGTVHQRFMRWQRKDTWKKILDILIDEPEYQFLMSDVHPDACGAVGGNQDMACTKGGLTQKSTWQWTKKVCLLPCL